MATVTIDKDKIAKSALRYIQKGQYSKAIEEYRRVLASDPKDIRLRLKLVDLYGRLGKKKEAVEECLQVAESYSDQGFYLKAVAVYKQAARIDPENPHLCQSMGDLYVKQGLLGEALSCYKRGVQLLRQQGRSEDAERLLSRMAALAPDNASVKINLAELYLVEGKLSDFQKELDGIIGQLKTTGRSDALLRTVESFQEKAGGHPAVVQRLLDIARELRQESRDAIPSAAREARASGDAMRHAGAAGPAGAARQQIEASLVEVDLYLKYGLDEKAGELLQELARRAPGDVGVRERARDLYWRREDRGAWVREQLALADIHRRAKDGTKAMRALKAVLEVESEHAQANRLLREVQAEQVGWSSEERSLGSIGASASDARANQTTPGSTADQTGEANSDGSRAGAFEEFELSEVDEIVREFKSGIAEKLEAGDFDTHYNLGMAYKEMGLLEDALEEFRVAARSPEHSREAYTCMAMVYRETDRLGDARAALKMALAGSTNTPEDEVAILFELGVLAEEEGDREAALHAYAKAAAINPDYRDLPQRVQLLQTAGS